MNADHYRKAKAGETPTFEASESGAESAIAELFPGESASTILEELLQTGMKLNGADRRSIVADELAQLKALVFMRQAARLQEQVARAVIRSQERR